MKYKALLITTIIFFLIVNTTYYWEVQTGFFAIPVFLLLATIYIILLVLLLRQLFFSIKEKFGNKPRLILIAIMIVLLGLVCWRPFGLIDFEKLEADNLLVAKRGGAANCLTIFKLKANNRFSEKSMCFGITEITGNYELSGDTIFFKNVERLDKSEHYYKYALIKKTGYQNQVIVGNLVMYKNIADTIGVSLWVTKNELKSDTTMQNLK